MAIFGKKKTNKEAVENGEKKIVKTTSTKAKSAPKKTTTKTKSAPKKTETKKTKKETISVEKKPFSLSKKIKQNLSPRKNISDNLSRVLLRPRITEKATFAAERNVYVFEIATDSTKSDVMAAVSQYYNVTPARVNMVKIPSKKRASRTSRSFGIKPAGKKAYVYLKDGDKIEIV